MIFQALNIFFYLIKTRIFTEIKKIKSSFYISFLCNKLFFLCDENHYSQLKYYIFY